MSTRRSHPVGYLITFTTYGTWMHGDGRGSVDFRNCAYGAPLLPASSGRKALERRKQRHRTVRLNPARRQVVERTVREVCEHRDWTLHALNVRSNHVHVVVSADSEPERVMNALKSWATRRMVEAGIFPPERKAWTRHGSTRYLWRSEHLIQACRYVLEGQGNALTNEGCDTVDGAGARGRGDFKATLPDGRVSEGNAP
jgi:REP element-mobilizing transposase RayT